MSKPPLIAVSANSQPAEDRKFYKHKPLEYGEVHLAAAVERAGGLPFMPYRAAVGDDPSANDALDAHAARVMDRCDGLLLSGGSDVNPSSYGHDLADPAWRGDPARDRFEIALYRAAIARGLPVLGVCRGAQLINVAEGGTLWQDLYSMRDGSLVHRSQEQYDALGHEITIVPDTELTALFGDEPHSVNSIHHQGLRDTAPSLVPLAFAPDGLVEAFVRTPTTEDDADAPWVLGVQWHPEWMQDRASQRRLFEAFVARAARRADLRGGSAP